MGVSICASSGRIDENQKKLLEKQEASTLEQQIIKNLKKYMKKLTSSKKQKLRSLRWQIQRKV